MCDVDAESVDTAVGPEAQCLQEVRAHLGVIPVQIRLLGGEAVQVPLPVLDALPRGSAECGTPVGGRLSAIGALAITEDVPLTRIRTAACGERLLEPLVQVGRVVGDDVDDDADAAFVQRRDHGVEVLQRAEPRIDVAIVGDVVAAVRERRRVERTQPHRVDAELREIVDAGDDARDVAESVAVRIREAARVDLVDGGLTPPRCCLLVFASLGEKRIGHDGWCSFFLAVVLQWSCGGLAVMVRCGPFDRLRDRWS